MRSTLWGLSTLAAALGVAAATASTREALDLYLVIKIIETCTSYLMQRSAGYYIIVSDRLLYRSDLTLNRIIWP